MLAAKLISATAPRMPAIAALPLPSVTIAITPAMTAPNIVISPLVAKISAAGSSTFRIFCSGTDGFYPAPLGSKPAPGNRAS
jgi:hypothetical protein